MIKASIDRPKLEKSLKRFAREFGETNAQAVVRWGVQTCREMAVETQVWGKTKTKEKQVGAIIADAYNVLELVEREPRGKRALNSPKEVLEWIELNRTRRNSGTAKLPPQDKKRCSRETFKKVIKEKSAMAGMAKGGWLGAGMDIAHAQKGQDRINIGKNFLGYAQKHADKGHARKPMVGWKPEATITNTVRHTASDYVLSRGASQRAIQFGLKKTVFWYRSALRRQEKGNK